MVRDSILILIKINIILININFLFIFCSIIIPLDLQGMDYVILQKFFNIYFITFAYSSVIYFKFFTSIYYLHKL